MRNRAERLMALDAIKAALDGYGDLIREGMGTEYDYKTDPDWEKYAKGQAAYDALAEMESVA